MCHYSIGTQWPIGCSHFRNIIINQFTATYVDIMYSSCSGRRQATTTLRILPLSALDSGETKNVVIEIAETKGWHYNYCSYITA